MKGSDGAALDGCERYASSHHQPKLEQTQMFEQHFGSIMIKILIIVWFTGWSIWCWWEMWRWIVLVTQRLYFNALNSIEQNHVVLCVSGDAAAEWKSPLTHQFILSDRGSLTTVYSLNKTWMPRGNKFILVFELLKIGFKVFIWQLLLLCCIIEQLVHVSSAQNQTGMKHTHKKKHKNFSLWLHLKEHKQQLLSQTL